MPVSIPTIGRLVSRARSDIEAALSNGAAWLRKTVEYGLAPVWAGLAYPLYGRVKKVGDDIVPGRQNSEEALLKHAVAWLGPEDGQRQEAVAARLTLTGTGTSGTTVPAGTRWRRDDGALYETEVELEFGTDDIEVVSIAAEGEDGYGADGNTTPGAELTLVSIVPGLDATWTVDGDISGPDVGGGADLESLDSLADRVLDEGANPPAGGRLADFEKWAMSVNGVGQAWAYRGLFGPGTVQVYFVRDDPDNPIPDGTLVASVQEVLDDEAPAQVGTVTALAVTAYPINLTIAITPNTTAIQDLCDAALAEAIALRAVPGDGVSTYFAHSWLTEAISGVVGEDDHDLTSPTGDITLTIGQLPTLGTTSYSTKT